MTPAINDPVMVLMLRVLSLVLSASIILACIRAFIFFGGAIKSQENLEKAVEKAGQTFERFADQVSRRLAEHEGKIIEVTAVVNGEHERRINMLERRQTKRRSEDRRDEDEATD
jgi:hypothetical protein